MAYVKKLSVNGTSYDIKDSEAAVNHYKNAYFAMIGDSNSIGYGWQKEEFGRGGWDLPPRGIFTVLPEYYPDATFFQLPAGTWSNTYTPNMYAQAQQIEGTPDVIITWCGGNDISNYLGNHIINLGYPDFDEWDPENFDETTTYGSMNKCLHYLRTTYPHAKIVGVIRTWKADQGVGVQKSIYGMINAIYKKYNCAVINLNDYSSICDRISNQMSRYFISDHIHYNELAYRELITPVFVGAINAGLDTVSDIDVETVYTDVAPNTEFDYTTIPRYLGDYFKTSGSLKLRNYDHTYQNLLLFQTAGLARHDNLNAIRLQSNTDEINYIHYDWINHLVTKSNFDKTYELSRTGLDPRTVPEGDYKILANQVGNWTALPYSSPMLLSIKVLSNLNRYITAISYDHSKIYTGTYTYDSEHPDTLAAISWTRVFQSYYGPLNNPYDARTAADGIYTITLNDKSLWKNIPDNVAPCLLIIRGAATGYRYYLAVRANDGVLITGYQAADSGTITWKYYQPTGNIT